MGANKHTFTPGEKENMREYMASSRRPRKNLMKLVRHINMLNPLADENSWEYIFYDRILDDDMVDFLLKMKLRKEYTIDELAKLEKMR